jgi:glutamate formiminotransferase
MQPDFGPASAPPKSGIVVVGACPWVMNYNVPLVSTNLEKAKQIARKVSERGGGLPNVQAMALLHGDNCIEIACNLLDMDVSGPDVVQCIIATLAAKEGIKANPGYLTGHSKQEIFQLAMEKLDIFHKL